jgi:excisionase family DNA binding protein
MSKQNSIFSSDDFFSRGEVAEILGVTHATITRSIHRGHLETVTIGSRRFILRETLQEIVADHEIADLLGIGKGD